MIPFPLTLSEGAKRRSRMVTPLTLSEGAKRRSRTFTPLTLSEGAKRRSRMITPLTLSEGAKRRSRRVAFAFTFTFAFAGCATPTVAAGPAPAVDASPLEKKLAQNPNDPEVNFSLGEDAESHGDLLRAEQYYLRAEALRVDGDRVVPRIIRVLTTAHRYGEALDRCQHRLQQKPADRATRYVEAALYVALDRPREAERDLNALISEQPKDADAYLALGRIYKDANDHDRAKQMFHKYLELAPEGAQAASVRFELADEGELP